MGRIRMYVLDLGRMHMDKSLLVANWQLASRNNQSPRQAFIEFPVSAYYIDHPGGKILFDAGCNPSAMGKDGRWPDWFQESFPWHGGEECHLPNRLAELGIGPDDLRYVVLSHMHSDHCGCLEYFRKARIVVHGDELSAALRAYSLHDHSGSYIWKDTDNW